MDKSNIAASKQQLFGAGCSDLEDDTSYIKTLLRYLCKLSTKDRLQYRSQFHDLLRHYLIEQEKENQQKSKQPLKKKKEN